MNRIVIDFLHELKQNNNREWFNENKSQYEAARKEMENFVDHLIGNIRSFDPGIGDLTAKQTLFRIYRDIRFSKDKTPYKTYFGSYMAPGGRKSEKAGYYIHLSPDECFVGGGSHLPVGENLKKVRSEIYYNLKEFEQIINKSDFKKAFGELKGERLSRPPQGFPKDFKGIELLKLKDFTVFQRFDEKEVIKEDFDKKILDLFKKMKPFNEFLNRALAG
jgi:uncharacterized protein (TIGR02453 family)